MVELVRSTGIAPRDELEERSRTHYAEGRVFDRTRYTSRAFHDLEVERLWRRTWQLACWESEIPRPGDFVEYEIAGESLLIVRGEDGTIRALSNVCRHRGTQLRQGRGTAKQLRCRFHGWCYGLDGTLVEMPDEWDFQYVDQRTCSLPEFRLERWAGLVFVSLAPDPESFEQFLGPMPERFLPHWRMPHRRVRAISMIFPTNWKVALEAFPEIYHAPWTHSQWNLFWDEVSSDTWLHGRHGELRMPWRPRAADAHRMPSSDIEFVERYVAAATPIDIDAARRYVAEGRTGSGAIAQCWRDQAAENGFDLSDVPDIDMLDTPGFLLFPNLVVYPSHGGTSGIMWRFRPNGDDPDTCIAELSLHRAGLPPEDGDPPVEQFPLGTTFRDIFGETPIGRAFDQDLGNLPSVQRGMRSAYYPGTRFGLYYESLLRNFEENLDEFLATDG